VITIFKKNDLANIFFLLPYCILIRLYSFIHPVAYEAQPSDSYISTFIFNTLLPNSYTQGVVAVVLVYLQAILINQLVNQHRIYQRPSSLAGMSYILLMSCMKELQILTPALIGITFIILAAFSVFNTYKQGKAVKAISNAALNSTVATAIYPPYAIVIVALLVGLGMLRSFRMKERFQFLLSWIAGFWVIGSFLFVLDALQWNFWNQWSAFGSVRDLWPLTQSSYLLLGLTITLLIITFSNYYNYKKKKDIEVRKKIDFLYWVLLVSFFTFLTYQNIDMQYLVYICLPVAVFMSLSWMSFNRNSWAELVHVITLGLIFYNLFMLPV